jgi:hypothetical protein
MAFPNYWNLPYRLRYLLSGNVQRPALDDASKRAGYARGIVPHINVFAYATLRTLLAWEGCGDFELRCPRRFPLVRCLGLAPVYALVRLFTYACGHKRRARFLLAETNQPSVLLGKRHVLLKCVKRPVR